MTDDILETPSSTPNFRTELAAQLAELMPEVVADGKIDVVKLQELLGEDSSGGAYSERFGLFWPGKARALRAAQEPTTGTLKPDFENSKDWDTTKNVFIEGDNLEVLKILQKHYHGKIKMIYIDPPYNTGKDFVYKDNYTEGLQSYLEQTQQWADGKKLTSNSESEGRYHSNWLNMMYPRLKLARNLLTDDGVIFISIDDNEVANLMRLCSEVFGEGNHLATFIWKSKSGGANDSGEVAVDHEYIVCFSRKKTDEALGLDPEAVATTSYNLADEQGRYSLERLDKQNLGYQKSLDYPIAGPDGLEYVIEHANPESPQARWRWSQDTVTKRYEELVFRDGKVYTKNYEKAGGKPRSLFVDERFGRTRTGSTEVRELLGGRYFDNPKPTKLLRAIAAIACSPDGLVLDFFAGSGSTSHAVMALNAIDGGTRRTISVQLPEPIPEGSDARGAGFATIADIARKRILLAAAEIESAQDSQLTTRSEPLDLGFRSFKLADTNFSKWRVASDVDEAELAKQLEGLRDRAKDDATADDLLTEILLKQGYSLTEQIALVEIAGLELRSVGEGLVLAYLNEHVKPTLEQLREILAAEPSKLIVLEDAFHGDDELKNNTAQLCKSKNIEFWTA